jgi:hypothetical protein
MNKKLMLLGLCMMGTFAIQADEPEAPASDTTTTIVSSDETVTTVKEEKPVNEDCGCGGTKKK